MRWKDNQPPGDAAMAKRLRRSRRRWRIATAVVVLAGLWLVAKAGGAIVDERELSRQQGEQIAQLQEKLGATTSELDRMTGLLAQSNRVIELFGGRFAEAAAKSGRIEVAPSGDPIATAKSPSFTGGRGAGLLKGVAGKPSAP